MTKPRFFQSVLKEIPADKVIAHVYPNQKQLPTLEERLPQSNCPDCDCGSWVILSVQQQQNGGKPYIECLNCGYSTHL